MKIFPFQEGDFQVPCWFSVDYFHTVFYVVRIGGFLGWIFLDQQPSGVGQSHPDDGSRRPFGRKNMGFEGRNGQPWRGQYMTPIPKQCSTYYKRKTLKNSPYIRAQRLFLQGSWCISPSWTLETILALTIFPIQILFFSFSNQIFWGKYQIQKSFLTQKCKTKTLGETFNKTPPFFPAGGFVVSQRKKRSKRMNEANEAISPRRGFQKNIVPKSR